jgi:hypothetical protein
MRFGIRVRNVLKFLTADLKRKKRKAPPKENLKPLEVSLDQFGAILFHGRLQMDKG